MSNSLESSIVRICSANGVVVGAGFLVAERHALTCAHVVAGALGLADDAPEKPQAPVYLDVPRVAPGQLLTARVVLWRPPRTDGGDDIAGLELDGDPPHGAQAAPLAQVEDLREHTFQAFGFPRGQDTGEWATGRLLDRQITNWVQIEDVKETGFAVEPGFSGTPVWDDKVQAVVGMVVVAERRLNLKTAFAIPLDVLAANWSLLESFIHPFIFLSYSRRDSELVTRLKTDLMSQDIHVWIDREGIQPGTSDWEEALRMAIRAARAVLYIASPNARSSRYVKDELEIAKMYRRPVYPIWIAGTQWMEAVPIGWGRTQYIDARESRYETAISELVEILNKTSSTPPKPPELDTAIPELVGVLNKTPSTPPKPPELDFEPRNPYKALQAFTVDDTEDFFGRDRLVDELVKEIGGMLLPTQPTNESGQLLTIFGPSGSGKSSVVMAGLLPDLQQGALPGSEMWVYLEPMMPGKRPIEALSRTLKPYFPDTSFKTLQVDLKDEATSGLHLLATQLVKQPDSKVVLLVDQFEELFMPTVSEEERGRFIDLLLTAATEPRGPLLVLLTLRADFYDRLLQYPALYHLIKVHQQPLLPMQLDDLRATIECPAALPDVQLTFEGNLVGDLLFEMHGQGGALPLLQFTLDQLFQKRRGHCLTLQTYREIGGIKGALSQHAQQTFDALPSEEHRKLARGLFVRLIDPGATEQDTTRRRADLSEFILDDPSQTRLLQETIDAFIAARLLTINEVAGTTTIEVSHEAVIREWKCLTEWMNKARQDIPLQQALSEQVAEWEQRGKPRDRLYRGSQLKEARAWASRNLPSKNEVAFLQVSAVQRIRYLVSAIAIVLLLVSTTWLTSWFLLHSDPTYVTNLQDDGGGSLRWAIANAPSGSTITFDTSLWGHTIMLTSNLAIAKKSLSIRGPGARLLTISNSTHHIDVLSDTSIRIFDLTFTGSKFNSDSLLRNLGTLTLTNSTVSGNSANFSILSLSGGGGIGNLGMLTLTNSTVSGNSTSGPYDKGGGGIDNSGGTLILTNSTISGNSTSGTGGGIRNDRTLILTNSTVSGNTSSGDGGGIRNDGTLTLTNSTVSGNTSSGDGGGIANYSTLTLTNSTVSGNSTSGAGGGIYNLGQVMLINGSIHNFGTLILTNSTVSGNSASKGSGGGYISSGSGGGIYNSGGTLTLTNSTISGNSSSGQNGGGGIANSDGMLILTNSTVSGNTSSAGGGGGIYNFGSKADITFCTIYGNTTTGSGGGIHSQDDKRNHLPSQVEMRNSIVAGNYAGTGPDISGTLTSDGYNLIGDRSGAMFLGTPKMQSKDVLGVSSTDLGIDPLLRDNGGSAQPHTWTHALLRGSPAIDLIPTDVCMMFKVFNDQRGVRRPQGKGCDSGAYEYVPSQ